LEREKDHFEMIPAAFEANPDLHDSRANANRTDGKVAGAAMKKRPCAENHAKESDRGTNRDLVKNRAT
jgi:hypothetical protein